MQTKLTKIALGLHSKGLKSLAQKVLNLEQRLKHKQEQESLAKKTKEDLRLEEILRQHQKDRPSLRFRTDQPEPFLPEEESFKPYKGRWEVHIQYPSFDEKGAPYFDQSSVNDFVTISEEQIKDLEKEEKQGYLKILSKRLILPKSRLK